MKEQVVAKGPVRESPAIQRVVRRRKMLPAKIEAAGRLIERVGIDEDGALAGRGPRRAPEALHANRDRGVRPHVDRTLGVVEPFVEVVEPGSAKPRVLPPPKPCGDLVE